MNHGRGSAFGVRRSAFGVLGSGVLGSRFWVQNPRRCGLEDGVCSSLNDLEVRRGALDSVVVDFEAGIEAEAGVEDERADERAGAVAGALQFTGERRPGAVEAERSVVAHAVGDRIQAGHDRGVRRECHRHVRVREFEAQTLAGKAIERRREPERAAVGPDAIGAQRIDGDEQHVVAAQRPRRDWLRPTRRSAAAGAA
ncbi:MAG TPA: hypothetical protein VKD69_13565 [Vicinamibacterales bacterium]|nr:hypothetical protein [Vicinamibacterales bacterium]